MEQLKPLHMESFNTGLNKVLSNNIEALLFFYNEPISFKKLATVLNSTQQEVETALAMLKEDYATRGLRIIISNSEAQLIAHLEDDDILEQLDKSATQTPLTPAVLETLAVILYIGKADESLIDAIRGVKSARTLKRLLRRGYIECVDDKYFLSTEAMTQLGVYDPEQLPNKSTIELKLKSIAKANET